MSPQKVLRLLVCMFSFSLATGCTNPCLELANQICNCQPDTSSEANCQTNAQNAEQAFPVRAQDQTYCQKKLDEGVCDCNRLNTPEGRANCGLSYAAEIQAPAR